MEKKCSVMKEKAISFVRDSIGSEDRNPFNLCDIKDKKKPNKRSRKSETNQRHTYVHKQHYSKIEHSEASLLIPY